MACLTCSAATNRPYCDDCVRATIFAANYDERTNLLAVRRSKLVSYFWECPTHGLTLWSTARGACRVCSPDRNDSPRAQARRAGQTTYQARCEIHGLTAHSVERGKCLTCFTKAGLPRARPDVTIGPRAQASRAGAVSYQATCEIHGVAAHATRHGKCLTCFTAGGAVRRWLRVPV